MWGELFQIWDIIWRLPVLFRVIDEKLSQIHVLTCDYVQNYNGRVSQPLDIHFPTLNLYPTIIYKFYTAAFITIAPFIRNLRSPLSSGLHHRK